MSAEEVKRLNARIRQNDERVEEIRDTHRLESKSQTDLIDSLRSQLAQAQTQITSLSDSQSSASAAFEALTDDLEKTKVKAKEEEEKCTKAIALLKTVRTKLVKAEKDRDEALVQVKEKDALAAEIAWLKNEVDRVRAEGVKEVQRVQTVMSANAVTERELLEKEWLARKGQWEIEAITAKAQHSKELAAKSREVERLEENVRVLGREKDGLFEEVQVKSGEVESARVQLDVLQGQAEEMRFRLRESDERMGALQEELADARRGHAKNDLDAPTTGPGAGELAALLSETTSRHEARLTELRNRMRTLELERAEAEESWSRTLQQRAEENERLRGIIAIKDREFKDALDGRRARDEIVQRLEADVEKERKEKEGDRRQIAELAQEVEELRESLVRHPRYGATGTGHLTSGYSRGRRSRYRSLLLDSALQNHL
jgi:chromosome segregation ATPase